VARKTVVSLVDDIDGGEADETVSFGLDGITYEIDLSEKNATILRESLASFVGSARRVGGRARRGGRPAVAAAAPARRSSPDHNQDVRQWARENGYPVSDRGRIAAEITAAYEKAH
jgi:hypothetical protein